MDTVLIIFICFPEWLEVLILPAYVSVLNFWIQRCAYFSNVCSITIICFTLNLQCITPHPCEVRKTGYQCLSFFCYETEALIGLNPDSMGLYLIYYIMVSMFT